MYQVEKEISLAEESCAMCCNGIGTLRAKLRINVQKKLAQKRVILSLTIILHR